MKEAACFLERTATMHQATQRHFPEENNLRPLPSLQQKVSHLSQVRTLHYDSAPIYTHVFETVTSI
jgi:hypothetical protein